jgi:hypothetical protein
MKIIRCAAKSALFLTVIYWISFLISSIILRSNKKEYNIRQYYPQNAINV